MNILLISANRERTPYPVFPIGLACLAGPLAAAGHNLRVLDLCFAPEPETETAQTIAGFVPEAIVVSIRNLDNVTWPGTRSYLAGVKRIVDVCRGKAPVIIGGSGFSLMPREILHHLEGDFGVVGEGEEVLPLLMATIARGGSPADQPGILTRESEAFVPPRPVELIVTPDRSLFNVDRYHREGGMANLQTKRGCPFTCVYCTYPLLEGTRMRMRPVAEIIAEIRELASRYGVTYLYFVDDIFNYPPAFALELCRAMTDAKLGVNWSAFINPGFMDLELLRAMVAAGCDAVEYGSDSGSPAMLASLGKSFGVDDIRASSRLCHEEGVDFAHYILFGGPGETEETILESFSLLDEVSPTAVIAMTGIRIYPGTPLHGQAVAEKVIPQDLPLLEPVFYISPAVRDRLGEIVTREAMERKNWVAPGLEINMSDAMLEALRHFPVRGPLWKLMKRLGRNRVNPLCNR